MRALLLVSALIAVGCDTIMSESMDDMRSSLDRARQETAYHDESVNSARDMSAVQEEMDRHAAGMIGTMGDLDEQMDRIARRCYGTGLAGMRARHGQLDGEVAHHGGIMPTIADLSAARAEVSRHSATMMSIYDAMDTAMEDMSCD